MKPAFLIAAVALAAGAPAIAQTPAPERLVDATKVFPMLDKFYSAPPADRSHLAMHYSFTENGKPATSLHLTMVAGGKHTPLPILPDGRVERIPTAADMAEHAQIAIDAPKGAKFAAHMSADTAIRPALEVNAADCAKAIDQYNTQVRRQAGVMALVVPKAKACTFPGAGSGAAVMGDGKTQPLPIVKGMPAFEPEAMKGARTVRLAKAPTLVSLE